MRLHQCYKQFGFATHFSHLSFHISIIALGFLQRQLHSAILQNPASAIKDTKFKQLPHLCKISSRSNRSASCSQSKQFITPCIVHGCGCGKSKQLHISFVFISLLFTPGWGGYWWFVVVGQSLFFAFQPQLLVCQNHQSPSQRQQTRHFRVTRHRMRPLGFGSSGIRKKEHARNSIQNTTLGLFLLQASLYRPWNVRQLVLFSFVRCL